MRTERSFYDAAVYRGAEGANPGIFEELTAPGLKHPAYRSPETGNIYHHPDDAPTRPSVDTDTLEVSP